MAEKRLPYRGKDNQGRWFVAKKSDNGIEIEIMAHEEASRKRMADRAEADELYEALNSQLGEMPSQIRKPNAETCQPDESGRNQN